MPATSGSPTQIATSQPTKTALSNTPADQFQAGDLGYAQDEFLAGNCPLYGLVLTGGPAVNGTTVLSVYQNSAARWVSLSVLVASATLVVPNIAALQALDSAGYDSGQLVNVQTLRSAGYFTLDKNSTATPDNITIVDALNATGNWLRQENTALSWTYQTTWYVDSDLGNDEAVGNVPGAALETVAELARRLTCVFQDSTYTVNLLEDIPVTDSFVDKRRVVTGDTTKTGNGSSIVFVGVRAVSSTFTAAAGTHNTAPASAAANAQAQAVRAAGSFAAADVGKLLVDGQGNTAWVLTEQDGTLTARVTDFLTPTGFWQASPAGEGTSSLCTVTKWRAPIITGAAPVGNGTNFGVSLYFQNIEFDDYNGSQNLGGVYNNGATISLWNCKISDSGGLGTTPTFFASGSFGFAFLQGVMVQHKDSANSYAFFYSGAQLSPGLMVQWLWGNGGRRIKFVLGMSPTQVQGFCVQAGWVESGATKAETPAAHVIGAGTDGSWLGVYNDFGTLATPTLAAIQINSAARVRVDGSIYGTAVGGAAVGGVSGIASVNGGIAWLARNMDLVTPQLCFNLVPTGAGTAFYLDALASTTGSITAANAGAVLPALIVCTTWAQYIGAVPAGWDRNMRNPANNGGFYRGL